MLAQKGEIFYHQISSLDIFVPYSFLPPQICGSGSLQCCETGSLNHLAENDFKPGESNTFEGDFIGTCDGFDLGESTTINLNNAIEIWHDGR